MLAWVWREKMRVDGGEMGWGMITGGGEGYFTVYDKVD